MRYANRSEIFLLGHSAGAHLASLVVLNPRFLEPTVRSAVVGVICLSGVYSFWRLQESTMRFFVNRGVFAESANGLTLQNYSKACLLRTQQCQCSSSESSCVRISMEDNSLPSSAMKECKCKQMLQRWEKVIDAWPMFQLEHNVAAAFSHSVPKPAFLLFTAEMDLTLLLHATDFHAELLKHNFQAQHIHVPHTTHFSIRSMWDREHAHLADDTLAFMQAASRNRNSK